MFGFLRKPSNALLCGVIALLSLWILKLSITLTEVTHPKPIAASVPVPQLHTQLDSSIHKEEMGADPSKRDLAILVMEPQDPADRELPEAWYENVIRELLRRYSVHDLLEIVAGRKHIERTLAEIEFCSYAPDVRRELEMKAGAVAFIKTGKIPKQADCK
jgi:acyl-CoA synthetase (AMP-forming)/AMP-acid ligase II